MAIQLDHFTVPCRDGVACAKQLAELLGVAWGPATAGPFHAVYVSDALTLDFDQTDEPFPVLHFCFHVEEGDFDAILERLRKAGIPYRSAVHGPVDLRVGTGHGGRIVYWSEPAGHQWEMLTVSYAREPGHAPP